MKEIRKMSEQRTRDETKSYSPIQFNVLNNSCVLFSVHMIWLWPKQLKKKKYTYFRSCSFIDTFTTKTLYFSFLSPLFRLSFFDGTAIKKKSTTLKCHIWKYVILSSFSSILFGCLTHSTLISRPKWLWYHYRVVLVQLVSFLVWREKYTHQLQPITFRKAFSMVFKQKTECEMT